MQLRIKFISSTAHTLPYSTADIVYGNENSQSEIDDVRPTSFVDSNGKESRISSYELTEQIKRHSNEKLGLKKSHSAEKDVEQMSTEGLRELVMQVCERDPSLILDVVDHSSQEERSRGGYHPLPDRGSPDWCVCGRCHEMPSKEERECSGQMPLNCISLQPDFDFIVMDPLVLLVARRYRQDILAAGEDQDLNCSDRHAAYRQFILWRHGHLGAGNRRVIPSCCVWKIRDQYPDNFGQYRGFVGGRLS